MGQPTSAFAALHPLQESLSVTTNAGTAQISSVLKGGDIIAQ